MIGNVQQCLGIRTGTWGVKELSKCIDRYGSANHRCIGIVAAL